MKKSSKQSIPHSWYKRKPYLHFDFALHKPKAVEYVLDKQNIIKHDFSPLIYYQKFARKYKKETGRFINKPRNIFYASHVDGYIYAYYSHILGLQYEVYLEKHGISDVVLAYRTIEKGGENYANMHFSREAFDFVKKTGGCKVLCIDLSGFFDHLCINTLKRNWQRVWSGEDATSLEEDHNRVFQSLKNAHYVEEKDIISAFNVDPRQRNEFDQSNQAARRAELNRSLHQHVCSFSQLNAQKRINKIFIKDKATLNITGVPQGTAISGMLANICMIDFDKEIKQKMESVNGLYRRYSDDIFIAFPSSLEFNEIETYLEEVLSRIFSNKLKINRDKTDRRIYQTDPNGKEHCYNENMKISTIQYLGFTLGKDGTHLRPSTTSRNSSKIINKIRRNKKSWNNKAGLRSINTRAIYKAHSPRVITPYENKGFISYAKHSDQIQNTAGIGKQIKKIDPFIKKRIQKERRT